MKNNQLRLWVQISPEISAIKLQLNNELKKTKLYLFFCKLYQFFIFVFIINSLHIHVLLFSTN